VVSDRYVVWRLFTMTGLDRQIPLARTRAQALAALAPAGAPAAAGTSRKPARRALAWTARNKHRGTMPPVGGDR
jgi:hypothetical protein